METSLSAPIDLFRSGFIAHLVSLSLDPSARIGKKFWPLPVTVCDLWLTSQKLLFSMHLFNLTYSLCFYRQMTSQRLQKRPKTSPRKTRRGSEWWCSPRARTTLLQLLVGNLLFFRFCLPVFTYFNWSTTQSHPNFGPFWTSLPSS